ncbi:hypothetical protein OG455_36995 [Kitasatospora sp. NBC_01287]|uniref:hypothetical protein n=1 Tax=Kitasatospora sp. NBC_01287 TaxID=2903573 RepID=UPI002253DA21|nr:hypothetical protein [Kitasatospora sp. NBC_01287]MCX4751039.1 hypothetical protein [Kitasatospora sp. NBC_01287]
MLPGGVEEIWRTDHMLPLCGPEFDPGTHDADTGYTERYGSYYGPFYGGPAV